MSYIHSISNTPAPFVITPENMMETVAKSYQKKESVRKFNALVKRGGIAQKQSVLPDFSGESTALFDFTNNTVVSTQERMQVFEEKAHELALKSAQESLLKSQLKNTQITHIITVSCTGMSAPGLEISLSKALGLNHNVQKHAVNFMGCYATFHALKLADAFVKGNADANVLVVGVELCTLHFTPAEHDDNLLSTYLFGDGSAAMMVSGQKVSKQHLELLKHDSTIIDNGSQDMAWNIGNQGFEMVLNSKVPKHILQHISGLHKQFTEGLNVQKFAIHPGGKEILRAFENSLGISKNDLDISYEVLQKHGNMSAVTILFIWKKILEQANDGENIYSAAFGPGLTIEQALFKIN